MYSIALFSIVLTALLRLCVASTSTSEPGETITLAACTSPLSQSDVDNSFFNPCPQYFSPLPSNGALSGSSLTIFGFPGLEDLSGSIIGADGTSTTYALTCHGKDPDIVAGQCTSSGAVFPLTASGWNWRISTTEVDEVTWTSAVSMTATIKPDGFISFYFSAMVTPALDSTSSYSTTYTWTGDVAMADPTIVPVVGLAKIGGEDSSSSASAASQDQAAATDASGTSLQDPTSTTSASSSSSSKSSSSRCYLLGIETGLLSALVLLVMLL